MVFVCIATDVIKAINECKDLQAFTLEGNTLGVEAAKAIAEALSKRPEFEVDDGVLVENIIQELEVTIS